MYVLLCIQGCNKGGLNVVFITTGENFSSTRSIFEILHIESRLVCKLLIFLLKCQKCWLWQSDSCQT